MAAVMASGSPEGEQLLLITEGAVDVARRPAAAIRWMALLLAAVVAALLVATSPLSSRSREAQTGAGAGGYAVGESILEEETKASKECSPGRANCNVTQCCTAPGAQCYEQKVGYAQCRPGCSPGPDPTHWDGKAWSCKELGLRKPGDWTCGKPGHNCRSMGCCEDAGLQCYAKNESFASCKSECMEGAPDLYDADGSPWTCEKIGEPAPGPGAWVQEECAGDGEDCREKQCCKGGGQQCYKQSDFWGQCKKTGSCTDEGWSCDAVGAVTPWGGEPQKQGGVLPQWVLEQCVNVNEGCQKSKCCLGMEVQCYEKDERWAQCLRWCTPGKHADDHNESWSCNTLGPRSYGVATKGFPSLYCFSIFRKDGYEPALMAAQLKKWAGIFACDQWDLLTADGTTQVDWVQTTQFQGAEIVLSIDNTAGNTELFVNAWNVVVDDLKKWRNHSFIVKADPDAVFIPERARWHLASHVGEKMFVVNCRVGDMMFGALEVFSYAAINEWAMRRTDCAAPPNFGEDKYMTTCMDALGVARVHDEPIMGDKLCGTFQDCSNSWNSAFHPFKDEGAWMTCYDQAMESLNNAR